MGRPPFDPERLDSGENYQAIYQASVCANIDEYCRDMGASEPREHESILWPAQVGNAYCALSLTQPSIRSPIKIEDSESSVAPSFLKQQYLPVSLSVAVYNHELVVAAQAHRLVSAELRDFVCRLLKPRRADRLGAAASRRRRVHGAAEVMAHPWFGGFDWAALRAGTLPAPWVPGTEPALGAMTTSSSLMASLMTSAAADSARMAACPIAG
jgi:hypothetical protein